MKANEFLTPKRCRINHPVKKGDVVIREAIDYGTAIYKGEFDGFGRGALGKDFEDFDKDVKNESEER